MTNCCIPKTSQLFEAVFIYLFIYCLEAVFKLLMFKVQFSLVCCYLILIYLTRFITLLGCILLFFLTLTQLSITRFWAWLTFHLSALNWMLKQPGNWKVPGIVTVTQQLCKSLNFGMCPEVLQVSLSLAKFLSYETKLISFLMCKFVKLECRIWQQYSTDTLVIAY